MTVQEKKLGRLYNPIEKNIQRRYKHDIIPLTNE
jgi:hypothetical protein